MGAINETATTMLQNANAGHFHLPNLMFEGGRDIEVVLL
tara:strand:+ start:235 stop:351 length:117 start_codon:yes stop_codon:yes gene_type:complete